MRLLLLLLASTSFAVGGLCMKYSNGLSNLVPSVIVFVFFAIGVTFQTKAMAENEMGVVYISVLGFEVLVATLLSVLVLHETINGLRVLSIIVILTGIALLQRSQA